MRDSTQVFVQVSVGMLPYVIEAIKREERDLEFDAEREYLNGRKKWGDALMRRARGVRREREKFERKLEKVYFKIERQAIKEIM